MSRKLILLAAILFIVPFTAALSFDVNVDTLTDGSLYLAEHRENATVQKVNLTVYNSGSIGCQYRLKGEFNYGNSTYTRYSKPYSLFPGSESVAELYFIAENYTGQVHGNVYIEYCDKTEKIDEFNYTVPEKVVPNQTVESSAREVTNYSAKVDVGVENGYLVPKETPPFWKASASKITNGSTTIHYSPPIFKQGEKLVYTVLNNDSEIVGKTSITLEEPEPTPWENLESNLLIILLTVSFAVNGALILRRLDNTEK